MIKSSINIMGIKTQLLLLVLQLGSVFSYFEKYPLEKGVHVIDKGERQQGDETLYSETLMQRGDSFGDGDEYCYPPRGSIDQIKITEYEVKDQDTGNDGGLAFEVSGGEGQSQVCFALRSRIGRRYRYKVDVYGFRLNTGMMRPGNAGGFGAVGNAGIGSSLGGMGSGYGGVGGGFGGVGSGYGGVGGGLGVASGFGANGLSSAGLGYAGNQAGGFAGNQAGGFAGNQAGGFAGNQVGGYAGNQAGGFAGNQAGGYGAAVPLFGNTGVTAFGNNGIPQYSNGNTVVPFGSGNLPNGQGTPFGGGNLYGSNSRGPFDYGQFPRKK